jgi:hypothetical protein
MNLVRSIAVVLASCAIVGCNESSSSSSTAGDSPAPQGSSAAAASPGTGEIGAHSVELQFTGQYQKGDQADSQIPVFKVTNKSSKKLHFIQAWHYYYDKDKKQLGRKFAERTVGTMTPGQSQEHRFGWTKSEMPPGTESIEAVLVGANFEGGVEFKGDANALAPEQRAMGAAAPASGGGATAGSPSTAPTSAAAEEYSGLTGQWINDDWGLVKIDGKSGTYTDTYGGGMGTFEFTQTAERTYTAKWSESKARHGTMKVTLSEDHRKLSGKWDPDPDCTIGQRYGGPVAWIKKR